MAKPTRYTDDLIREYTEKGYWEPVTLSGLWDQNAKESPEGEAAVDSRIRFTWAQAKQWIDRMALGFHVHGIKRDELIVVQLVNSVELCLTRVACEKAGVLCLPVLRTLHERDMAHILKQTEAAGVVTPDTFRGLNYVELIERLRISAPHLRKVFIAGEEVPPWAVSVREIVQRPLEEEYPRDYLERMRYEPTEVSLLNPTTGTTGFPKFAEYPMCARLIQGKGVIEALELTGKDILAAISPAPGGPNVGVYFAAPRVAAKVVFLERFEAEEALRLIEKERVTVACVVPAQLALMLQHPGLDNYDLDSLRAWFCTGAPLPYNIGKEIEERTKGVVINFYGGVDFGGLGGGGLSDPIEVRMLTVGKPRARTDFKIVDGSGREVLKGEVGNVWGRGPSCSSGFYRDPERTSQSWTKDGWFKTGDQGKIDGQGNLVIVGREKDIIIRGGWNIYPDEIENVLLTHPRVEDIAIVGMPDPVLGERLCAYIVPKSGETCSLEEISSFAREGGLPSYKLPERLEVLKKLPKVAGGLKVDKKVLRRDIAEKIENEEMKNGI